MLQTARRRAWIATVIAGITIVVMATTAIGAGAQSVEVTNESTAAHCAAISLSGGVAVGGCQGIINSDALIALEAFGALTAACDMTHNMAIDEDGNGYLYAHVLTGLDCSTPACTINGVSQPWRLETVEQSGSATMELEFCLQSQTLGSIHCHLTDIQASTGDHGVPALVLDATPCEGGMSFIHLTGSFSGYFASGLELAH